MREKGYGYYWKNENCFKWVEEKIKWRSKMSEFERNLTLTLH